MHAPSPSPPARTEPPRWLPLVAKPAALLVAYVVGALVVFAFQSVGQRMGNSSLGIVGLAIDTVALALLVPWLGRRGHAVSASLGPLLALFVVILFFAAVDAIQSDGGAFWTLRNARTIAAQTSTVAVAALGMTMIIISGGIDLSAGTALALCATSLAYGLNNEYSVAAAIALCLVTGAATGLLNGALISLLRVVPFIITLGTMTAYLGIGKRLANQTTIRPPLEAVPDWLTSMVTTRPVPEWIAYPLLPNFASGVWLALGLAVVLAGVLHLTVFGRHVFALGSNESTARLCGINVPLVKTAVYTLAGLFIGVAGMYQFARLSSGNPTSGIGIELKVIAAVVIGGGSLSGGRGSVVGTLTGAAIMLVISSGCTHLDLENSYQDIIIGAIIVAAVALDQYRQRRHAV